jgi:hypothetical protein
MLGEVGLGLAVASGALYLTFLGTAGMVQVATLLVTGGILIWFATVEPGRLIDAGGRPRALLFGLAGLGLAVALASALVLGTATTLLLLAVAVAAVVVGLTRAVRFGHLQGPSTPLDDR